MGATTQQLVVDEIAKEGAVGAAGLAHKASGNIISPILQQVRLVGQNNLAQF
jgi:hypothetical protein